MVRKARTEYSDRNNVVRLGVRYNYRTKALNCLQDRVQIFIAASFFNTKYSGGKGSKEGLESKASSSNQAPHECPIAVHTLTLKRPHADRTNDMLPKIGI